MNNFLVYVKKLKWHIKWNRMGILCVITKLFYEIERMINFKE